MGACGSGAYGICDSVERERASSLAVATSSNVKSVGFREFVAHRSSRQIPSPSSTKVVHQWYRAQWRPNQALRLCPLIYPSRAAGTSKEDDNMASTFTGGSSSSASAGQPGGGSNSMLGFGPAAGGSAPYYASSSGGAGGEPQSQRLQYYQSPQHATAPATEKITGRRSGKVKFFDTQKVHP